VAKEPFKNKVSAARSTLPKFLILFAKETYKNVKI